MSAKRPVLVPGLITRAYASATTQGSFSGGSLFLDLSGFTRMTSVLMEHGNEGAETVALIINRVFNPLVDAVYEAGGFVGSFAGDAFTAFYPDASAIDLARVAFRQMELIDGLHLQRTAYGEFALDARIGIGAGETRWAIVDAGETKRSFFFRGRALQDAALAEQCAAPGNVVVADSLIAALSDHCPATDLKNGFARISRGSLRIRSATNHRRSGEHGRSNDDGADASFRPPAQLPAASNGEFRSVAPVFLSLRPDLSDDAIVRITSDVLALVQDYDGYFDLLDFSDKGPLILVLFGAPQSHGQTLQRAVAFAWAVREALGSTVRMGLAEGITYAGYVGSERRATYSVLGETVNLAARIAATAQWGALELPMLQSSDIGFRVHEIAARSFKGLKQPVSLCRVDEPAQTAEPNSSVDAPMVGREQPLAELRNWVTPLKIGTSAGVLQLTGEAGIGKSLLVRHLSAEVATQFNVIELRADPILHKSLNLFPALVKRAFTLLGLPQPTPREASLTAQHLLEAYRRQGAPADKLAELERTWPALPTLMGYPDEQAGFAALDPQARFELTVALVQTLIGLIAHKAPTLLIADDAHALDQDSSAVLRRVVVQTRSIAVGVLLVSRHDLRGDKDPGPVVDTASLRRVRLEPLSRTALTELLAEVVGGPVSADLCEMVAQRVGLNPFFAAQLARHLRDNDLLVRGSAGYRIREGDTPIPKDVAALLVERVDALPPAVKDVARIAAIVGTDFDAAILRKIVENTDIDRGLAEGTRLGLWALHNEGSYRFTQQLMREAVESMQLHDQRRRTHKRIAEAITAAHGDDGAFAVDIAFHYEGAEQSDQARTWLWKAFEYARDNFMNAHAVDLLQRYMRYTIVHEDRLRAQQELAAIYEITGQWDRAADTLTFALGLSLIASLPETRTRLLAALGTIYQRRGDNQQAITVLESAIELAGESDQRAAAAEARVSLGRAHWASGNYDMALAALEQARSDAEATGDAKHEGLAHYFMGVVLRDQSRYRQAMQKYRVAYQRFEQLGDDRLMTYPLYDMGIVLQYQGDLQQSRRYFQQVHSVYVRIGYQSGISAALLNLGVLEDRAGNFIDAIEYFVAARTIAEAIEEKLALAYTLFSMGATYFKMHDNRKSLEYLKDALKLMRGLKAKGYYGYPLSYLVCLYARLGDPNRAIRLAWYNVRSMQAVGTDVENGRTHMGIAMVLGGDRVLSSAAQHQLREIDAWSGVTEPSPDGYFQKAIEIARAAGFVNTLIPALHHYGTFLQSHGRENESVAYYREALRHARSAGWRRFVERMQLRYPAQALEQELEHATT